VTKLLNYNLNPDYFNINASNQLSPVFELKGLNSINNPIKINTTTKLLEFGYNTSVFWIDSSSRLRIRYITDGGFVENSGGMGIKLADTSLSLSTTGIKLNADAIYFDIGTSGLQPKFLCTGIDAGTPLSLNLSKLKLDINPDYFNINASNQLSPVFELKGLNTVNNPIKINTTTKLLEFGYSTNHFSIDGSNNLKFKYTTYGGIMEHSSGILIKLADTSLSLSTLGLQISTTYKSELQQIKTDTETFKTQAETAKTAAETARTEHKQQKQQQKQQKQQQKQQRLQQKQLEHKHKQQRQEQIQQKQEQIQQKQEQIQQKQEQIQQKQEQKQLEQMHKQLKQQQRQLKQQQKQLEQQQKQLEQQQKQLKHKQLHKQLQLHHRQQ
jgi:hypothetical protein